MIHHFIKHMAVCNYLKKKNNMQKFFRYIKEPRDKILKILDNNLDVFKENIKFLEVILVL